MALAIEILCFCPPDKLTPFYPISVKSPPPKISKSGFSSQIYKMFLYLYSSYYDSNKMFYLIVALLSQEV